MEDDKLKRATALGVGMPLSTEIQGKILKREDNGEEVNVSINMGMEQITLPWRLACKHNNWTRMEEIVNEIERYTMKQYGVLNPRKQLVEVLMHEKERIDNEGININLGNKK